MHFFDQAPDTRKGFLVIPGRHAIRSHNAVQLCFMGCQKVEQSDAEDEIKISKSTSDVFAFSSPS